MLNGALLDNADTGLRGPRVRIAAQKGTRALAPPRLRQRSVSDTSSEGRSLFASYCVVLPMTAICQGVTVFLLAFRKVEDSAQATVAPEMGLALVFVGMAFFPAFLVGLVPWLLGRLVLRGFGWPRALAAALVALPTIWCALLAFAWTLNSGVVPNGMLDALSHVQGEAFRLAGLVGSLAAPLFAVWASAAERD